jgi:MFS family permease
MASAMLYTLITDVTPAADRTHSFYLLHAVVLILGVAMKPISALFLNWDPWINMWIGLAAVVLGTALSLLIPETSKLRQEADDRHLRDEVDEPNEPSHFAGTEESTPSSSKDSVLQAAWNEMRDAGIKMGKFVLASKKLMWLMACLACMFPVDSAFTTFLLQYMTKRYNWSWSTATYVSNIGNVTGLAVLIGILPLTSSLLTSRAGLDPLTRDLYLLRASAVCITLGAAFMSFSVTPPIFIVSLVMYSLGQGYFGICRALLIAIVEPHMIATLNTTIGTVQSIVGSVGVPAIGWLVGRGFDWGGLGSGLPYMVVFGITVVMTVALFLWKVPREFEQRQRSD